MPATNERKVIRETVFTTDTGRHVAITVRHYKDRGFFEVAHVDSCGDFGTSIRFDENEALSVFASEKRRAVRNGWRHGYH